MLMSWNRTTLGDMRLARQWLWRSVVREQSAAPGREQFAIARLDKSVFISRKSGANLLRKAAMISMCNTAQVIITSPAVRFLRFEHGATRVFILRMAASRIE